jgi:hypothetical protein
MVDEPKMHIYRYLGGLEKERREREFKGSHLWTITRMRRGS